jgi:hypothetical protein
MSSYKGVMKKVPPTRPTMNPRDNTNRRFLLPISGVRSAVEKTNTIRKIKSTSIMVTTSTSMVSSLGSVWDFQLKA